MMSVPVAADQHGAEGVTTGGLEFLGPREAANARSAERPGGKALPGLNAGRLDYWGRGAAQHPQNQIRTRLGCARLHVGARQGASAPTSSESERLWSKEPRRSGLLAHRLFRRYDLVDRSAFGLNVVALFIGLVQELVDDASALLLFDPSLLHFLLFGEEIVVYFPAH
jgi:hypothetical protein